MTIKENLVVNYNALSKLKRSIKITDHFICTSANVIYCTFCNKLYIGETGRRQATDSENTFAKQRKTTKTRLNRSLDTLICPIILSNISSVVVCGLSLHQGSTECRKTLEQKFIFKSAVLILTVSTNAFHSTFYSVVFRVIRHQPIAELHLPVYKPHTNHNSLIRSDEGLTLETSAYEYLYGGQFTLSTQLIKPNYLVILPRSTTVSLETYPLDNA